MRAIAVLAVGLILSGCVSGVTMGKVAQTSSSERIAETNFTIGEPMTAIVGDQVVRVKDYIQTTVSTAAVRASGAAQFDLGMSSGVVEEGVDYPLVGERQVEGARMRIVSLGSVMAQVREDGRPHIKGLVQSPYGDWIEPIPNMVFTPPITFIPVTQIDTSSAAAGENYEIVFTGRDADSLRFQYREYTPTDMARPAFSQDLTYPVGSRVIRFRGLSLNVIEVGPDSITFAVASRERR